MVLSDDLSEILCRHDYGLCQVVRSSRVVAQALAKAHLRQKSCLLLAILLVLLTCFEARSTPPKQFLPPDL
jgi:hypothetical protein